MKHFIDENGQIFGFEEDGSQDHLIKSGMKQLTQQEVDSYQEVELSIDEWAAIKRSEINAASVQALSGVRNEYPDYEQLSWDRQEREAKEGGGPLIDSIAAARGLEISELIDSILEKANLYQQAAGAVIGKRQALEDQIAAALEAEDREAIQALSW